MLGLKSLRKPGWGIAAAVVLAAVAPVMATTVVTDFNNFALAGTYGSWATATITSGAADYRVEATGGFGGGYYDIDPNANGRAGETTLELSVTLHPTNQAGGIVVALEDADGTLYNFGWWGLANGTMTLTAPLASPSWAGNPGAVPGLDVADLAWFHIQADSTGTTDVSYEHMALTGVPEPATLALLGLGLVIIRGRRQHS